jgi:hypothetical protein
MKGIAVGCCREVDVDMMPFSSGFKEEDEDEEEHEVADVEVGSVILLLYGA